MTVDRSKPSADEIRRQMQIARRRLRVEVDEVVSGARQLADWKYYVRQYTWPALSVVAALGYLAIPRKLHVMSPDVETLKKLAGKHQLVIDPKPAGATRPGLIDTLLTMSGNILLRAGVAYVGQNFGKLFGEAAAESPAEEALHT